MEPGSQTSTAFESLMNLLRSESIPCNTEDIDSDIIVPYVSSVAEDLDSVDLDELTEIMEAYVPGFEQLTREKVEQWIHCLKSEVVDQSKMEKTAVSDNTDREPARAKQKRRQNSSRTNSECETAGSSSKGAKSRVGSRKKRTSLDDRSLSESSSDAVGTSNPASAAVQNIDGEASCSPCRMDEAMELLLDMFPDQCSLSVSKALVRHQGDLELTISYLIQEQVLQDEQVRQSTNPNTYDMHSLPDESSRSSDRKREISVSSVEESDPSELEYLEKQKMKEQILERFGYLKPGHQNAQLPAAVSKDEKKMVRYRDSQVVSTKGERYKEVKTEMTEEMKKTYVNLKPARKYRFH